MTSKEYLNVHELASLFGLNVQTLHYYDKVGVFKPSDRDPGNRYRKYRFDQIYELASIRYMRKLGYSVGAVREFQDTREPDVSLKRLKERSAAIRAQWEELMRIDQAIMRKVQFIEECRDEIEKDVDLNGFKIVEFPGGVIFRLERRMKYLQENLSISIRRLFFTEKTQSSLVHFLPMIRWKIRRGQRLRPSRQESILSATIEGLMSRFRRALTESDPMAVSINSTIQCWPLILLTSLLKRRIQII